MADAPSPDSVARVVRWAIILFFAYALWHTSFSTPKPLPTPPAAQSQHAAAQEKDCDNNPLEHFPAFTMPLLPAILPARHIEDITPGAGAPAQCGQTASVRYEYATGDGTVIFSNMNKNAPVENMRIGTGKMLRGAELGLIGMKPGGKRSITLSPPLAFAGVKDWHTLRDSNHFSFPAATGIKNTAIVAKLSLLSLSPELPSSPMPVRMIDTRFGSGARAECGDTVTANITLWKLDGTKLFSTLDSKPVTFTLGKSEVPLGIDQGATDMMVGGERTLIMPPAFTSPLTPCFKTRICEAGPIPVQFPKNETVLVEMTRLPAVEKSAATPNTK